MGREMAPKLVLVPNSDMYASILVSKDTSEGTLSILFEKSPLDSTNDDKKPCVPYGTHPTTPNFLKHPTTEELSLSVCLLVIKLSK